MTEGVFQLVEGSDIQVQVNDMPEGAEFENLGTTVEVITQGGTLVSGGKQFELQQFHFHLPSEHLDNGTSQASASSFPNLGISSCTRANILTFLVEMHMVWQSAEQEIAVIGMYINVADGAAVANGTAPAAKRDLSYNSRFFRRQAAAPPAATAPTNVLETIFSVVDQISTPGTKVKTPPLVMSEVVDAIKANALQTYSGSLTTPPCSEGVAWHVSTAKLSVSPATFVRAANVIGFNSRFPQNTPGQPNILMISALGSAAAAVAASGAVPA
jgi:hypothetical protein